MPDWLVIAMARRYLTPGGRILLGGAVISLVLGFDPDNMQLHALALLCGGVAAGGLLVGLLAQLPRSVWSFPAGDFALPLRSGAGVPVALVVQVQNRGPRTAYDLEAVVDRPPAGLTAGVSNRLRCLAPGQEGRLELSLTAQRRGAYEVGPVYVGTTYPFGIFRLGGPVGGRRRLLVTPNVHLIAHMDLSPGMRYQPGGVPMASQTGESLEFVGVRDYRQGDSLRKIHWKLWARRGTPVVREYTQEYFARVGVILDTYAPGPHFEAAVEVSASVAGYLARQDAIVDFFAAGSTVYFLSAGRHLGSLQSILDVLACVKSAPEAPYSRLEAQLQGLLPALSAVVLVTPTSRVKEAALTEFVARLRASGTPLRVLAVGPRLGSLADCTWLEASALPAQLERL